jgi:NAD(P)-dependent dehydrogenase (short-subunit alcohol dehydrogenase family)
MPDSHEGSLAGRRALVTGASRGIGAAIARRFAELGADVALAARSTEAIQALAKELADGGVRAVPIQADLTDRDSLAALMARVGEEFGGLDILVNNAGVLPVAERAERLGWDAWDATFGLNLSAPWYLACRAKELMGERGGVIVNNASTAAYFPSRGLVAYNVSKSALIMLTRVLALEWARAGVRVVGVAPGKIETDLVALDREAPAAGESAGSDRRGSRGRRPGCVPGLRPSGIPDRDHRADRRRRAAHRRIRARTLNQTAFNLTSKLAPIQQCSRCGPLWLFMAADIRY